MMQSSGTTHQVDFRDVQENGRPTSSIHDSCYDSGVTSINSTPDLCPMPILSRMVGHGSKAIVAAAAQTPVLTSSTQNETNASERNGRSRNSNLEGACRDSFAVVEEDPLPTLIPRHPSTVPTTSSAIAIFNNSDMYSVWLTNVLRNRFTDPTVKCPNVNNAPKWSHRTKSNVEHNNQSNVEKDVVSEVTTSDEGPRRSSWDEFGASREDAGKRKQPTIDSTGLIVTTPRMQAQNAEAAADDTVGAEADEPLPDVITSHLSDVLMSFVQLPLSMAGPKALLPISNTDAKEVSAVVVMASHNQQLIASTMVERSNLTIAAAHRTAIADIALRSRVAAVEEAFHLWSETIDIHAQNLALYHADQERQQVAAEQAAHDLILEQQVTNQYQFNPHKATAQTSAPKPPTHLSVSNFHNNSALNQSLSGVGDFSGMYYPSGDEMMIGAGGGGGGGGDRRYSDDTVSISATSFFMTHPMGIVGNRSPQHQQLMMRGSGAGGGGGGHNQGKRNSSQSSASISISGGAVSGGEESVGRTSSGFPHKARKSKGGGGGGVNTNNLHSMYANSGSSGASTPEHVAAAGGGGFGQHTQHLLSASVNGSSSQASLAMSGPQAPSVSNLGAFPSQLTQAPQITPPSASTSPFPLPWGPSTSMNNNNNGTAAAAAGGGVHNSNSDVSPSSTTAASSSNNTNPGSHKVPFHPNLASLSPGVVVDKHRRHSTATVDPHHSRKAKNKRRNDKLKVIGSGNGARHFLDTGAFSSGHQHNSNTTNNNDTYSINTFNTLADEDEGSSSGGDGDDGEGDTFDDSRDLDFGSPFTQMSQNSTVTNSVNVNSKPMGELLTLAEMSKRRRLSRATEAMRGIAGNEQNNMSANTFDDSNPSNSSNSPKMLLAGVAGGAMGPPTGPLSGGTAVDGEIASETTAFASRDHSPRGANSRRGSIGFHDSTDFNSHHSPVRQAHRNQKVRKITVGGGGNTNVNTDAPYDIDDLIAGEIAANESASQGSNRTQAGTTSPILHVIVGGAMGGELPPLPIALAMTNNTSTSSERFPPALPTPHEIYTNIPASAAAAMPSPPTASAAVPPLSSRQKNRRVSIITDGLIVHPASDEQHSGNVMRHASTTPSHDNEGAGADFGEISTILPISNGSMNSKGNGASNVLNGSSASGGGGGSSAQSGNRPLIALAGNSSNSNSGSNGSTVSNTTATAFAIPAGMSYTMAAAALSTANANSTTMGPSAYQRIGHGDDGEDGADAFTRAKAMAPMAASMAGAPVPSLPITRTIIVSESQPSATHQPAAADGGVKKTSPDLYERLFNGAPPLAFSGGAEQPATLDGLMTPLPFLGAAIANGAMLSSGRHASGGSDSNSFAGGGGPTSLLANPNDRRETVTYASGLIVAATPSWSAATVSGATAEGAITPVNVPVHAAITASGVGSNTMAMAGGSSSGGSQHQGPPNPLAHQPLREEDDYSHTRTPQHNGGAAGNGPNSFYDHSASAYFEDDPIGGLGGVPGMSGSGNFIFSASVGDSDAPLLRLKNATMRTTAVATAKDSKGIIPSLLVGDTPPTGATSARVAGADSSVSTIPTASDPSYSTLASARGSKVSARGLVAGGGELSIVDSSILGTAKSGKRSSESNSDGFLLDQIIGVSGLLIGSGNTITSPIFGSNPSGLTASAKSSNTLLSTINITNVNPTNNSTLGSARGGPNPLSLGLGSPVTPLDTVNYINFTQNQNYLSAGDNSAKDNGLLFAGGGGGGVNTSTTFPEASPLYYSGSASNKYAFSGSGSPTTSNINRHVGKVLSRLHGTTVSPLSPTPLASPMRVPRRDTATNEEDARRNNSSLMTAPDQPYADASLVFRAHGGISNSNVLNSSSGHYQSPPHSPSSGLLGGGAQQSFHHSNTNEDSGLMQSFSHAGGNASTIVHSVRAQPLIIQTPAANPIALATATPHVSRLMATPGAILQYLRLGNESQHHNNNNNSSTMSVANSTVASPSGRGLVSNFTPRTPMNLGVNSYLNRDMNANNHSMLMIPGTGSYLSPTVPGGVGLGPASARNSYAPFGASLSNANFYGNASLAGAVPSPQQQYQQQPSTPSTSAAPSSSFPAPNISRRMSIPSPFKGKGVADSATAAHSGSMLGGEGSNSILVSSTNNNRMANSNRSPSIGSPAKKDEPSAFNATNLPARNSDSELRSIAMLGLGNSNTASTSYSQGGFLPTAALSIGGSFAHNSSTSAVPASGAQQDAFASPRPNRSPRIAAIIGIADEEGGAVNNSHAVFDLMQSTTSNSASGSFNPGTSQSRVRHTRVGGGGESPGLPTATTLTPTAIAGVAGAVKNKEEYPLETTVSSHGTGTTTTSPSTTSPSSMLLQANTVGFASTVVSSAGTLLHRHSTRGPTTTSPAQNSTVLPVPLPRGGGVVIRTATAAYSPSEGADGRGGSESESNDTSDNSNPKVYSNYSSPNSPTSTANQSPTKAPAHGSGVATNGYGSTNNLTQNNNNASGNALLAGTQNSSAPFFSASSLPHMSSSNNTQTSAYSRHTSVVGAQLTGGVKVGSGKINKAEESYGSLHQIPVMPPKLRANTSNGSLVNTSTVSPGGMTISDNVSTGNATGTTNPLPNRHRRSTEMTTQSSDAAPGTARSNAGAWSGVGSPAADANVLSRLRGFSTLSGANATVTSDKGGAGGPILTDRAGGAGGGATIGTSRSQYAQFHASISSASASSKIKMGSQLQLNPSLLQMYDTVGSNGGAGSPHHFGGNATTTSSNGVHNAFVAAATGSSSNNRKLLFGANNNGPATTNTGGSAMIVRTPSSSVRRGSATVVQLHLPEMAPTHPQHRGSAPVGASSSGNNYPLGTNFTGGLLLPTPLNSPLDGGNTAGAFTNNKSITSQNRSHSRSNTLFGGPSSAHPKSKTLGVPNGAAIFEPDKIEKLFTLVEEEYSRHLGQVLGYRAKKIALDRSRTLMTNLFSHSGARLGSAASDATGALYTNYVLASGAHSITRYQHAMLGVAARQKEGLRKRRANSNTNSNVTVPANMNIDSFSGIRSSDGELLSARNHLQKAAAMGSNGNNFHFVNNHSSPSNAGTSAAPQLALNSGRRGGDNASYTRRDSSSSPLHNPNTNIGSSPKNALQKRKEQQLEAERLQQQALRAELVEERRQKKAQAEVRAAQMEEDLLAADLEWLSTAASRAGTMNWRYVLSEKERLANYEAKVARLAAEQAAEEGGGADDEETDSSSEGSTFSAGSSSRSDGSISDVEADTEGAGKTDYESDHPTANQKSTAAAAAAGSKRTTATTATASVRGSTAEEILAIKRNKSISHLQQQQLARGKGKAVAPKRNESRTKATNAPKAAQKKNKKRKTRKAKKDAKSRGNLALGRYGTINLNPDYVPIDGTDEEFGGLLERINGDGTLVLGEDAVSVGGSDNAYESNSTETSVTTTASKGGAEGESDGAVSGGSGGLVLSNENLMGLQLQLFQQFFGNATGKKKRRSGGNKSLTSPASPGASRISFGGAHSRRRQNSSTIFSAQPMLFVVSTTGGGGIVSSVPRTLRPPPQIAAMGYLLAQQQAQIMHQPSVSSPFAQHTPNRNTLTSPTTDRNRGGQASFNAAGGSTPTTNLQMPNPLEGLGRSNRSPQQEYQSSFVGGSASQIPLESSTLVSNTGPQPIVSMLGSDGTAMLVNNSNGNFQGYFSNLASNHNYYVFPVSARGAGSSHGGQAAGGANVGGSSVAPSASSPRFLGNSIIGGASSPTSVLQNAIPMPQVIANGVANTSTEGSGSPSSTQFGVLVGRSPPPPTGGAAQSFKFGNTSVSSSSAHQQQQQQHSVLGNSSSTRKITFLETEAAGDGGIPVVIEVGSSSSYMINPYAGPELSETPQAMKGTKSSTATASSSMSTHQHGADHFHTTRRKLQMEANDPTGSSSASPQRPPQVDITAEHREGFAPFQPNNKSNYKSSSPLVDDSGNSSVDGPQSKFNTTAASASSQMFVTVGRSTGMESASMAMLRDTIEPVSGSANANGTTPVSSGSGVLGIGSLRPTTTTNVTKVLPHSNATDESSVLGADNSRSNLSNDLEGYHPPSSRTTTATDKQNVIDVIRQINREQQIEDRKRNSMSVGSTSVRSTLARKASGGRGVDGSADAVTYFDDDVQLLEEDPPTVRLPRHSDNDNDNDYIRRTATPVLGSPTAKRASHTVLLEADEDLDPNAIASPHRIVSGSGLTTGRQNNNALDISLGNISKSFATPEKKATARSQGDTVAKEMGKDSSATSPNFSVAENSPTKPMTTMSSPAAPQLPQHPPLLHRLSVRGVTRKKSTGLPGGIDEDGDGTHLMYDDIEVVDGTEFEASKEDMGATKVSVVGQEPAPPGRPDPLDSDQLLSMGGSSRRHDGLGPTPTTTAATTTGHQVPPTSNTNSRSTTTVVAAPYATTATTATVPAADRYRKTSKRVGEDGGDYSSSESEKDEPSIAIHNNNNNQIVEKQEVEALAQRRELAKRPTGAEKAQVVCGCAIM